jgi:hypothetical protein
MVSAVNAIENIAENSVEKSTGNSTGNSDVTVVLTSCKRQDLLERTIDSFLTFNTYPVARFIITEDGATPGINDKLKQKYAALPILWIEEPQRRGQIACIDDAYSRVETKYIFHCEDDWEFYDKGFIEKSRVILENCPGVMQVWLRAEFDTNGHPLDPDDYAASNGVERIEFRRLAYGYTNNGNVWYGFSFNPGLRRLADYKVIGGYAPHKDEIGISFAYKSRLFSAVILSGMGFVRHIGDERHIYDSTRGF